MLEYVGVNPRSLSLLVHHDDGEWAGYSYEWNSDQSDATLLPAGKELTLPSGHAWTIPSRLPNDRRGWRTADRPWHGWR